MLLGQLHTALKGLGLILILFLMSCSKSGKSSSSSSSSVIPEASTLIPVTLLSPNTNYYISSSGSLTISGICTAGSTISLSGSEVAQTPCFGESFSFSVSPQSEGTYNYSIKQSATNHYDSIPVSLVWVRDSSLPATPVLSAPVSPYRSNQTPLSIVGSCTDGNTVNISGDYVDSVTCSSGSFSISVPESTDGDFSYSITQTDSNNRTSGSVGVYWNLDTTSPNAPTILTPPQLTIANNQNYLNISGVCENNANLVITGADSTTLPCNNGEFTYNSSKSADSVYTYAINQVDLAGNNSSTVTVNWTRDTNPSASPSITNHVSPYISNQSSLTLAGACVSGETVMLSGDHVSSTTCTSSSFSFNILKTTDQTYNFSIHQVDPSGNSSQPVSFVWILDRTAPSSLSITNPFNNPYTSSDSSLTLSGTCETGSTINLTGDDTKSSSCNAGVFNIVTSKSADNTYNFSLSQTDQAGNSSTSTSFQWIRNSSIPSTPQITFPTSNPYFSNGNTLQITGTCEVGNSVTLGGSATDNSSCLNGTFSFTISKNTDDTYVFDIYQTNLSAQNSATASVTWIRDTAAPIAPTINTPFSSPWSSSTSSVLITGTCISGNTVSISGASTSTTTCSNNSYSITVNSSNDGTLNYNLIQTDPAGNTSPTTSFTWIRDTQAPNSPVITNISSPYHSKLNSLTLSGSCDNNSTINLSGASTETQNCTSGQFSFSIAKSVDGEYNFSLTQTDLAGNNSNPSLFKWYRDTVAPSAPTVNTPSTNPYTSADDTLIISGSCETGASIATSNAENLTTTCSSSAYSLTLNQTQDATYAYAITQTDLAGNASTSNTFQWIRSSSVPTTPSITFPAMNPYYSNSGSLTLSGTCVDGNTVLISGDQVSSTTCSSSAFTFNVNKSVDSTYNFTIKQRTPSNISSAGTNFSWILDTVAPVAPSITSAASPLTNNASSITITGTCTSGNKINVSGSAVDNVVCAINNTFSLTMSAASDDIRTYTLTQSDLAGNVSSGVDYTWIRDTVAPGSLSITSHSSPYRSNQNSITISGICESGSSVHASGASTGSTTCNSGTFSHTVTKTSDGSYTINFIQTDPAGNNSSSASLTWTRDTVAPIAPVITNLGSNPYTSSDSTITLQGSCETDAVVTISGDTSTQSNNCTSGNFTFSVSASTDGSYQYNLKQTDLAGNDSSITNQQWVRSSSIPETPTISSPSSNPYHSNGSSLAISGTCSGDNTVEISGDATATTSCSSSSFSINVNKSSDASYAFVVKQKTSGGVYSAGATVNWVRDTVSPTNPTITTPAANPYYSNGNSVTIAGTCSAGNQIILSGGATGTATCTNENTFSLTVNKTTDGSYILVLNQKDLAGNQSQNVSFNWTRDTIAPGIVTLNNPTDNPYTSSESNLVISGSCEPYSTVNLTLSGATSTSSCTSTGTYSFTASKSTDGTYSYTIQQVDRAGNTSGNYSFTWNRTSSIPFTPVITAPTSNPTYSKLTQMVLTVTCEANATVYLFGDILTSEMIQPAGTTFKTCSSGLASFTISKSTENTFNIYAYQISSGTPSSVVLFKWIRDTTSPSAPTITTPSSTPYVSPGTLTIQGECEPNSTVAVSGDDNSTTTCSPTGSYSFNITESADGSYSYSILQTDLSGNASSATTPITWTRNSNSISPPTITSTFGNPYYFNGSSITLTGNCTNSYTVELSGASSGSTSCSGGSYQFVINKSTDNTYQFNVKQTFNGSSSSMTTFTWIRDTVAPSTSITENPSSTNCLLNGTFVFNSSESNSLFECKIDYESNYTSCSSPITYENINNGSRTFSVRAIDKAGNVGTASTYSWTQNSYKTLALYHLNSTNTTQDSSGYANHLTAVGSPGADTTGALPNGTPQSRTFSSGNHYKLTNNACISAAFEKFTAEMRFKITANPSTNGNYYGLLAKSGTAAGSFGWEIRLMRNSSQGPTIRYVIRVLISMNGSIFESIISPEFTMSLNTWYSLAVTANTRGRVEIWFGQNSVTRTTISEFSELPKYSFHTTTADMIVGNNGALTSPLAGSIDEVRISQVVRPISTTISTQEFNPD